MNTLHPSSYWISSADLPKYPAPSRDYQVDVIVVGGGITGITTAYLMKKAGLTVALLERSRLAGVDTGHTTAHLTRVTDLRLHEIVKTFGEDTARAVWDAGGAAIDQIVSLVRGEEIACDFRWVPGFLHAPLDSDDGSVAKELQEEAATADKLAIAAKYVEKVPIFGRPGVRFPHQALFHPRKYLASLVRAIPGDGSHVFENAAPDEILSEPLRVKCGGHTVTGGYLVLATHNPLMGNAGAMASALFQTKLALYSSYALSARVPEGRFPEGAFWDTNDPYYYLRTEHRDNGVYAVFGGEDHKTGQVEDTVGVFKRLQEKFLSFAPSAVVEHRWSGQVIETNDGLPFIGETAAHQFIGTGFAGNGMTFGTLTAMMAVDAVMKRKNPWAAIFDVHRKKLLGGTGTYLAENKDYPYYLVRNWLAGAEGDSVTVLGKGEGRILSLNGKKVAAYRDEKGRVSLCSPICTHLQCIVAWNNAERTWDCPCHGSRFKPTGEVISGPAEEPLSPVDKNGEPVSK